MITKKNIPLLFVTLVVLIPVMAFAVIKWYEKTYDRLPVLGKATVTKGLTFRSHENLAVQPDQMEGQIIVANYFFTHCPAVCPKMFYQLQRLKAYGDKDVLVMSFTVDPERDSVQQLKKYADKFNVKNNWLLLTGNKKDLYRYARKDLMIVATDGDGGADDFIHSEKFVLIDKKKNIRGYYQGTDETDVNRLINDINKLKNE